MYNLIMADLFKIRKSKSLKILFGITTVTAVLMTLIAYLIPQGKLSASMSGIGFLLSDVDVVSIVGAVLAGIFICGDFDNKIIHEAIATGSSRASIIVSKVVVFSCSLIFILLPYVIATAIALVSGHKFGMEGLGVGFLHLISVEGGKTLAVSEIGKLLVVILTLLLVYVAQLSLCVPLALALKKPVLVVAIFYGLSISCPQLIVLAKSSQVFNNIFACTPYGGNYTFVTMSTAAGDFIKAASASVVFIVLMVVISYFAFRKAEIK
jgi:ABC-2 type transport system permease protein